MARIHLVTDIAADPATVFDLSIDIDVHMASTAPSSERAVKGVVHGRMALGDTVTWRARHFGITWRMSSRIAAYERPVTFTDEMQRGPFHHWHHVHSFEPLPDGGTRMVDEVDYAPPLPLPFLHGYMTRLLEARNAHIREVAERRAG